MQPSATKILRVQNFRIILLITLYAQKQVDSVSIPILSDIQDIIGLANDIQSVAQGNVPFKSLFVPTVNPLTVIMDTVFELTALVEDLGTSLHAKLDKMSESILERLPLERKIDDNLRIVHDALDRVDNLFEQLDAMIGDIDAYRNSTLSDFIKNIQSSQVGSLQEKLDNVVNVIVPRQSALEREGLWQLMLKKENGIDPKENCDKGSSFQYRLQRLYDLVVLAETKSIVMTAAAYKILNYIENTNHKFVAEMNFAKGKFVKRTENYLREYQKLLPYARRDVFRCDPKEHIRGNESNFIEFEGTMSTILLSADQVEPHQVCMTTCDDFGGRGTRRCDGDFCNLRPCHGFRKDCTPLGFNVEVCENDPSNQKRYKYVKSNSRSMIFGDYSEPCLYKYYSLTSPKNYFKSIKHCVMCLCVCIEDQADSTAIRTFSLLPAVSDIDSNMVISDLRFQIVNNSIIVIQIQQSELLPEGRIDWNDTEWVDPPKFRYLPDAGWQGGWGLDDESNTVLKMDLDYLFLNDFQNKFDLDELVLDEGYVLTGVRFKFATDEKNYEGKHTSHLRMEIQGTPFNFSTGKLEPSEDKPSIWVNIDTVTEKPEIYTLRNRIEQARGWHTYDDKPRTRNDPDIEPNKFFQFGKSVILSFEGGQTTLPLLDSRPVTQRNAIGLDGLSLIYRIDKEHHYGGIIAFRALTMNLSPYITSTMTPEQVKYFDKISLRPGANKRGRGRKNRKN